MSEFAPIYSDSFRCRKAYFLHSESLVEDVEYDKLLDELTKLEQEYPQFKLPDSPTEAVGASVCTPSPKLTSGERRYDRA